MAGTISRSSRDRKSYRSFVEQIQDETGRRGLNMTCFPSQSLSRDLAVSGSKASIGTGQWQCSGGALAVEC
jgi:hypothetical protein